MLNGISDVRCEEDVLIDSESVTLCHMTLRRMTRCVKYIKGKCHLAEDFVEV